MLSLYTPQKLPILATWRRNVRGHLIRWPVLHG